MSYKFFETYKPSDKCRVSLLHRATYVTYHKAFELDGMFKSRKCYKRRTYELKFNVSV